MLIDTHAHLDYPDYDPDRSDVITRAHAADVKKIISIGTTLNSSAGALKLSAIHDSIFATVGIHPCEVDEAPPDVISQLRTLAQSKKVVALGEIGLDYYHLPGKDLPQDQAAPLIAANKTLQENLFRQQMDLAVELGLNVVIHQRNSWDDALHVLNDYSGKVRCVFHCFGGSIDQARLLLDKGHLISFTGIVTFKNAALVQECARLIPEDGYMVETDCPYLAPAPHRGKRCEPSFTRIIAEKIAELRGTSLEEVAQQTTASAKQFFRW